MAIADLDAELIRIREPQSRRYLADAVLAYRAGAYRPAISATWVALAFDLIQKYRELASLGEAEASAFIVGWDNAVANGDTTKLTKMEGELLDHAHSHLSMFSSAGLRSLKRLREDRHTSAHPAYISTDELYEPSDELARSHIMAAIEIVLSQQPVRGRGIIETFGADLVSPGFPYEIGAAMNYVEQKYLAHMRPGTVKNFGAVLAKSLIRENVPDWTPHIHRRLAAVYTVQQRRPSDWPSLQADLLRLMNDDSPDYRSNVLIVLGWFPHLFAELNTAAALSLAEHCRNGEAMMAKPRAFQAAYVPTLSQDLTATFARLQPDEKAQVITAAPVGLFWPYAIQQFRSAGSFRAAENLFDTLIAPYSAQLNAENVSEVFEAVASNGQIWNASGTSSRLLSLLDATGFQPSAGAVLTLYNATSNGAYMDATLTKRLIDGGWVPPASP